MDKPLVILHGQIKSPPFSVEARGWAGFLLRGLQRGRVLTMKQSKRDKLTKLGYRITSTQKFLGLSTEEMALIELKISLIEKLKETRGFKKITQQQLARLIRSSQSRIAMLEQGRPDVSLDLICRALFALGVSRRELGRAITSSKAA